MTASSNEERRCLTSKLFGGYFAFVFLSFEVVLRLLSKFLIHTAGISWRVIFRLYSILPVCFMMGVLDLEGMSIPATSEDASSSFATDTTLRRQHVEYGTYGNKTQVVSTAEENQNEKVVVEYTATTAGLGPTTRVHLVLSSPTSSKIGVGVWQHNSMEWIGQHCWVYAKRTRVAS